MDRISGMCDAGSRRPRRGIAIALALTGLWVSVATPAWTSAAGSAAAGELETRSVAIAGRIFQLEFARSPRALHRGLGGRTQIEPYGGMLFAYATERPLAMVMRDCPIPIDVAFLDARGRVVALHAMTPEPPRGANETPRRYESRLPTYASGGPAQFAVELAGGRLAQLGVRVGDLLMADWAEITSQIR